MNGDVILMFGVFGVVSSVVLMLYALISRRGPSVESRLTDLSRRSDHGGPLRSVPSWLPRLGAVLMPRNKANRERLHVSLVQAGFYRRHTSAMFFGTKLLLMVCPVIVGMALEQPGTAVVSQRSALWLGSRLGRYVGAGCVAPQPESWSTEKDPPCLARCTRCDCRLSGGRAQCARSLRASER